jgi:hypothetical protein
MAVIHENEYIEMPEFHWGYYQLAKRTGPCMHCQRLIDPDKHEPFLFWKGGKSDMVLHRDCANFFLLALARDVWQLKQEEGL